MNPLGPDLARSALGRLGSKLSLRAPRVHARIVLAGGTAGLFAGLLSPARTTTDCDVIAVDRETDWHTLASCAREVSVELGLASGWLSRECAAFAWALPLGWRQRVEPVGEFDTLYVERLSRFDLLGSKLLGAPQRPQDLEDLEDIAPTSAELLALHQHLDRLAREDLGGNTFAAQREILRVLAWGDGSLGGGR